MLVLITYDVNTEEPSGAKRLRNIAKQCKNFGKRVQYSVFECELDPTQFEQLKNRLLSIYSKSKDSLRFYKLGSKWQHKIEHFGAKKPIDLNGSLII